MATNNKKYPHFVENQVLRSSTLNDSFAFVDEQARLSRVHLFGTGIVEGLGFSMYGGSLIINPGIAVDKDGWLVQFEEKTGYYYAANVPVSDARYVSDSLDRLMKDGGSHISMICFKTEDDAKEFGLDPIPMSDVDMEKYVVAIAFGKRNELGTKCSHDRCDINIVNEILEPWPVLIPVSEIPALYKKIEPISHVVIPKDGPRLENHHGDIVLFNEQLRKSLDAWKSEIDSATTLILNDILLKDSSGENVSIWRYVFEDCDKLIERLREAKTTIQDLGGSGDMSIPDYFLSFFGDMTIALNELFDAYNDFAAKYKVVPNVIPSDRLIYLGCISSATGSDVYCSLFKGALNPSYEQDCIKLQKMLARICVLTECFIGDVPESQIASYPFKVQKVRNEASLSKRPVPFYYDTERVYNFLEIWNADLSYSALCVDGESACNTIVQDGYSLYPTAYQGKDWAEVSKELEELSRTQRLSIEISEAGIKSVAGLSKTNKESLVKFFKPMISNNLSDSLDAIKKGSSGMAGRFLGFIRDIVSSEHFLDDLNADRVTYRGSYKNLVKLAQIKEDEVWEIVGKIKESKGLSASTYPQTKDKATIFSAFTQLIRVCMDSFFACAGETKPEGMERVVFMGPVNRGSKVYLFTKSFNGNYEESSPRTVVSYGVDYINPTVPLADEDSYLFMLALKRAEKGKKLAEIPDVVAPYGDDDRWKNEGDTITIYPCVDGAGRHLYSTDISNIEATVSNSDIMTVQMSEVADVEKCIPAVCIKMKKNGTSKVSLSLKDADGSIMNTKEFTVSVNNPEWNTKPVTKVELSKTSLQGFVGQSSQLTATVSPSNATNKGVTWSSTNLSIAKVDQNGNVSYIAAGSAKITVTTADGGKAASSDVMVSSLLFKMAGNSGQVDIPSVLNSNDSNINTLKPNRLVVYPFINDGKNITMYPADKANVEYSASNTSVLSFLMSGFTSNGKECPALIINFLKNGTSIVTLKIKDDNGTVLHTKQFTLNINNPEWNIVHVTGVSLPFTTKSLFVGQNASLSATVLPSNATNKKVKWSVSSSSIATIDSSGVLRGVGAGSTRVTVTTEDGSKTASAEVKVSSLLFKMAGNSGQVDIPSVLNSNDSSINTLKPNRLVVYPFINDGKNITMYPADKANVEYSASNTSVLSFLMSGITSNGKECPALVINFLKNGTSIVTLKIKDDNGTVLHTKQFTLNINNPEWSKVAVSGVSLPFTTKELFVGQNASLSATVLPSNATNKKVKWSVLSSSIATIDSTGVLKGVCAGSTRVTVTTEDGSKTASAEVKVSSLLFKMAGNSGQVDIPSVLNSNDSNINTLKPNRLVVYPFINDGKNITMYPADKANVEYSASNTSVLSFLMSGITSNGKECPALVINFLKVGTSTVTLKIKGANGTVFYTKQFTINVKSIKKA